MSFISVAQNFSGNPSAGFH